MWEQAKMYFFNTRAYLFVCKSCGTLFQHQTIAASFYTWWCLFTKFSFYIFICFNNLKISNEEKRKYYRKRNIKLLFIFKMSFNCWVVHVFLLQNRFGIQKYLLVRLCFGKCRFLNFKLFKGLLISKFISKK